MTLYDHNGQIIRADGWYNDQTGYGGSGDSIKNTRYLPDTPLQADELEAHYTGNWVIRRGVEIPVDDRLAKGIEFLNNDDDSESRKAEIESLQDDIKTANIIHSLMTAEYWGRLYGGGLLYFDYGDEERFSPRQSVSVDGLNTGGASSVVFELKDSQRGLPNKIWVVDRWRATPMSYYNEMRHGADHPKLGEVEAYSITLQTTGWSKLVYAHESRCVKIDGLPLPPRLRAQNLMWGNSVVQPVNDICKYFGIGLKAMADTLEDFNWKTLQIENLMELIASNSAADSEAITMAASLAAKNYHNQSIGLHGKETLLTKHSTTVTGLPDMVNLFSNFVAAAFYPGIPDSIFFSAKGGALAGTSAETDVRNYFKCLRRLQEIKDRPAIEKMIFLLGRDPKSFPFIFPKMEEPTEMEQIEARDKQADVDGKYIDRNVILPEEVRASRFEEAETNLHQTVIDHDLDKMIERDEEDMETGTEITPQKQTVVDEIQEDE